jgi:aminoglycoside phosphotransferase (APT) family kinase protein
MTSLDKRQRLGQGRTAEIFAWGDGRVIKLFRHPDFEGAAQAEAGQTRLAHAAGAPAPAVFGLEWIEGRPGIVCERVEGRTMLAQMLAQVWGAARFARDFANLHARIHRCSGAGLAPQARKAAELSEWVKASALFSDPVRGEVLDALAHLPDGDRLCHGDFHPDNILLTRRGPVVIDWMNAWRGHPLADVARTALLLRLAELPPGVVLRLVVTLVRGLFHEWYLRHYFRAQTAYARADLEAWMRPMAVVRLTDGIASEQERLLALIEAGA